MMTWSRRLCTSATLLLVTGCMHRPPPPLRVTDLVVQDTPRGIRPYVRVNVAGQPLLMLLDTGAAQSILPAEFARKHNLPKGSQASGEHVIDANGSLTYMPLLPNVPVRFEGEATSGTMDFLMNPAPDRGEAILAPQDLVRPGWAVVIDLDRAELRYEREEAVLRRLGGDGSPLRKEEFGRCLISEGPFYRNHRVVSTTVNGVAAEMLVDTGAERTVLARNNPALPSMMSAKGDRRVSAAVTSTGQGFLVVGVPIEFAGTAFLQPVVVLPASQRCGTGLLGADVLRSCTIVWGWSSLWVACHSPLGLAP
jgi:hypothetical protein